MKKTSSTRPLVGIIMGSDTDWPTMKGAADACVEFGIEHEVSVISAHRTPHDLSRYAVNAHKRGLRVIIAGAGGAAHLPGVTAAFTPLPVIGVPIESKALKGLDSLLSIVQMPSGIPVATVAIGGGRDCSRCKFSRLEMPRSKKRSWPSKAVWPANPGPRTQTWNLFELEANLLWGEHGACLPGGRR